MRNPLQTTITHAAPVFDSFSAALGRGLRSLALAVESSGMTPAGKARATYTAGNGHTYPLVVLSVVADGPELPDPDDLGSIGQHSQLDPHYPVHLGPPDLEADGYSWGPNARDLLYAGLTPPETTETPC